MMEDIKEVIDQFSSFFIGASLLLLLSSPSSRGNSSLYAWPLLFASNAVDPLDF